MSKSANYLYGAVALCLFLLAAAVFFSRRHSCNKCGSKNCECYGLTYINVNGKLVPAPPTTVIHGQVLSR